MVVVAVVQATKINCNNYNFIIKIIIIVVAVVQATKINCNNCNNIIIIMKLIINYDNYNDIYYYCNYMQGNNYHSKNINDNATCNSK